MWHTHADAKHALSNGRYFKHGRYTQMVISKSEIGANERSLRKYLALLTEGLRLDAARMIGGCQASSPGSMKAI